jgi:hypothetical protein
VIVLGRLVKRAMVAKSDDPLIGADEVVGRQRYDGLSKECDMSRGELQGHTWLLMMMMRMFGESVVRTLLAWPLAGVSQGQENAAMALKIPQN